MILQNLAQRIANQGAKPVGSPWSLDQVNLLWSHLSWESHGLSWHRKIATTDECIRSGVWVDCERCDFPIRLHTSQVRHAVSVSKSLQVNDKSSNAQDVPSAQHWLHEICELCHTCQWKWPVSGSTDIWPAAWTTLFAPNTSLPSICTVLICFLWLE